MAARVNAVAVGGIVGGVGRNKRLLLAVLCIVITLSFVYNHISNGRARVAPENRFNVSEMIANAQERNDIETLQELMPWLDIISARWKYIVFDNNYGVPAPSDVFAMGLLTLDSDYLQELEKYHWYADLGREIPSSFLTDEMADYALYTSQEYKNSYMPLFSRKNLDFYIDFEKEIVWFELSGYENRRTSPEADSNPWVGSYSFYEFIESQWGSSINMQYDIIIYETGGEYHADLIIDGFQTMLRAKAIIQGNNEAIDLVFDSYSSDNLHEWFNAGDILLTFTRDYEGIITTWGKLQPIIAENEKAGVYFE